MNSQQESDKRVLQGMVSLLAEREQCYAEGFQTSALCEKDGQWRNVVTHFGFVQKDGHSLESFTHEYPGVIVTRRLMRPDEAVAVIRSLVEDSHLATGTRLERIPLEAHFQSGSGSRNRYAWREWTDWPSDVFTMEPTEAFRVRGGYALGSLAATDAPYYPRPELILRDLFGMRSTLNGWPNGLEGTVVVTLPDFRARVSRLVVAANYLRVDVEHLFANPADLLVKVYAEGITGLLAQESFRKPESSIQVDLAGRCTNASVALLCKSSGEVLDERHFQEGSPYREEGVILETSKSEIEQMLLTGEGETLEFKEKVNGDSVREQFAKTAVAFANTGGGTIVLGVDDELRVVGCDNARRLADSVTDVLRGRCDLMPVFSTEIVRYEDKDLLLVHVARSEGTIYTVRERGPFIRANASNRSPTAQELEGLRGGQAHSQLLGISGVPN